MSQNEEVVMTLDEAVTEVLNALTGMDLQYEPELDRYQAITRTINRALRTTALEKEWSYFSDVQSLGTVSAGDQTVTLPSSVRPRMVNDDAVRLVNPDTGQAVVWAYFLPRDAIHKYPGRTGLWVAVTRNTITFSRPIYESEDGLEIQVPVMREPIMFRLPGPPEDPEDPLIEVPDEIRNQELDFPYPDLIVLRTAFLYAQTDPVMQPRVQTIEAQYKDLMYQVIERDDRMTDSPFLNDFNLGLHSDLSGPGVVRHWHPHADERR